MIRNKIGSIARSFCWFLVNTYKLQNWGANRISCIICNFMWFLYPNWLSCQLVDPNQVVRGMFFTASIFVKYAGPAFLDQFLTANKYPGPNFTKQDGSNKGIAQLKGATPWGQRLWANYCKRQTGYNSVLLRGRAVVICWFWSLDWLSSLDGVMMLNNQGWELATITTHDFRCGWTVQFSATGTFDKVRAQKWLENGGFRPSVKGPTPAPLHCSQQDPAAAMLVGGFMVLQWWVEWSANSGWMLVQRLGSNFLMSNKKQPWVHRWQRHRQRKLTNHQRAGGWLIIWWKLVDIVQTWMLV